VQPVIGPDEVSLPPLIVPVTGSGGVNLKEPVAALQVGVAAAPLAEPAVATPADSIKAAAHNTPKVFRIK
jgi:hypothetical protein